jgi:hypothetical protein
MNRVEPETIAVARRLYEDKTLPVREVARKAGIDPKRSIFMQSARDGAHARTGWFPATSGQLNGRGVGAPDWRFARNGKRLWDAPGRRHISKWMRSKID